jgi:hypothetical protein
VDLDTRIVSTVDRIEGSFAPGGKERLSIWPRIARMTRSICVPECR